MANPKPNTSGLVEHQFDSDSARRAAQKSAEVRAGGEPLTPATIKVYARQKREFIRRGENMSAVIRTLLDEYLDRP